MVHIQSEILLSHKKKNEIMSLAATWVSLEIITTGSQKERQICDIIYRWNLKYDTNELISETETGSQTQRTNLRLPKGKTTSVGVNQEFGVIRYKLLYMKQINKKYGELYLVSRNKT